MISIIYFFFNIILVLLAVAYFTLVERLVIGAMQSRIGPKKVGFGLLQPLVDGGKLFFKALKNFLFFVKNVRVGTFVSMFLIMVFSWYFLRFGFSWYFFEYRIIIFLCLRRIRLYLLFIVGWRSNSKYGLLGSHRGIAQNISYEVSFLFMLLVPCFYNKRFTLILFQNKNNIFLVFFLIYFFLLWLILILGESHRTPFDFAEGERELVSGYKIEYRSLSFIFLFLTEYGNIILICYITSYFFFRRALFTFFFIFFCIWTRASFPRFRFDMFMEFSWSFILPLRILNIFLIFF